MVGRADWSDQLAQKIRDAMKEAGITSAELARAVGATQQDVYEWRKTGRVHKRWFALIARATNKPLTYFLGEDQLLQTMEDLQIEYGLTKEEIHAALAIVSDHKRKRVPGKPPTRGKIY
jgi:transcriptional regulator with XRE-family HTH domain